jgi:hypothetical protein
VTFPLEYATVSPHTKDRVPQTVKLFDNNELERRVNDGLFYFWDTIAAVAAAPLFTCSTLRAPH